MKSRDQQKINEAILYVSEQVPNMYNLLKVLYFADKIHLSKYGRFIINDDHKALPKGPVPSFAYDLIKEWRGDGDFRIISIDQSFNVTPHHQIKAQRTPDMDYFSESDVECLNEAIEKYGKLHYKQLERIGHNDPAYIEAKESGKNDIDIDMIAKSLENSDEVLEYIAHNC